MEGQTCCLHWVGDRPGACKWRKIAWRYSTEWNHQYSGLRWNRVRRRWWWRWKDFTWNRPYGTSFQFRNWIWAPDSFGQDRDADGVLSKIFHSVGHDNAADEKDKLQKIFRTIDTDGTGSCSIEELTVCSSFMIVINSNLERIKQKRAALIWNVISRSSWKSSSTLQRRSKRSSRWQIPTTVERLNSIVQSNNWSCSLNCCQ